MPTIFFVLLAMQIKVEEGARSGRQGRSEMLRFQRAPAIPEVIHLLKMAAHHASVQPVKACL